MNVHLNTISYKAKFYGNFVTFCSLGLTNIFGTNRIEMTLNSCFVQNLLKFHSIYRTNVSRIILFTDLVGVKTMVLVILEVFFRNIFILLCLSCTSIAAFRSRNLRLVFCRYKWFYLSQYMAAFFYSFLPHPHIN